MLYKIIKLHHEGQLFQLIDPLFDQQSEKSVVRNLSISDVDKYFPKAGKRNSMLEKNMENTVPPPGIRSPRSKEGVLTRARYRPNGASHGIFLEDLGFSYKVNFFFSER
jgi:hypothetical protein